jgi:hypothetical protein
MGGAPSMAIRTISASSTPCMCSRLFFHCAVSSDCESVFLSWLVASALMMQERRFIIRSLSNTFRDAQLDDPGSYAKSKGETRRGLRLLPYSRSYGWASTLATGCPSINYSRVVKERMVKQHSISFFTSCPVSIFTNM